MERGDPICVLSENELDKFRQSATIRVSPSANLFRPEDAGVSRSTSLNDGRSHWEACTQRKAHHPCPVAGGVELSEDARRQTRDESRQVGIRQGRGDHRSSQQAVRRRLDQPLAVRNRSRDHQADPLRDRSQVPDHPAQPLGRHADDRDDRSDQRVRHGRHQVHDGLQRGAGCRLRNRCLGSHPALLRHCRRASGPRGCTQHQRSAWRASRRSKW